MPRLAAWGSIMPLQCFLERMLEVLALADVARRGKRALQFALAVVKGGGVE